MLEENLKRFRYQCGLTQKQIADLLSVDRSTYTYYETGRTRPTVDMLVKIAKVYRTSCDELMGYKVEKNENMSTLMHSEQAEHSILREAMLLCDLDCQEQNLILIYRVLFGVNRQKLLDFADGIKEEQGEAKDIEEGC